MTAALFTLAVLTTIAGDEALALVDRAQLPPDAVPYTYYVTTAAEHPDQRGTQATALRLVMPQLSPRQPILERCLPQPVEGSETLFRVDLRQLHWDVYDEKGQFVWHNAIADYPYSEAKYPLTLRADWLLIRLTDSQESDTYYRLVFGGVVPKTRDEALKAFGVNTAKQFQRGLIAAGSPVSIQGERRIINFPTNSRAIAYLTEDYLELDRARDPLEHPEGSTAHDGEEGIVMFEKIISGSGETGYGMAYFLSDGNGTIVNRAPVDLVRDYTHLRGLDEIRNGSSCISCHAEGFNHWKTNQFRAYLEAGVEVYADYKTREQLEAFHLIDLNKSLLRANEDYCATVRAACGCEPKEAVLKYRKVLGGYDLKVVPERAAHELGLSLEELELALAYASKHKYDLGARVSGLAHGKAVDRDSWESQYLSVRYAVDQWRQGLGDQ